MLANKTMKSIHLLVCSTPVAWTAFRSDKIRNSAKYVLRSAWMPRITFTWLNFLYDEPMLYTLVRKHQRLLLKMHRGYLANTFTPHDRLVTIRGHYRFLLRSQRTFFQHMIQSPLTAVRIGDLPSSRYPEIGGYLLALEITDQSDREGELLLTLKQGTSKKRVACLAFSISADRSYEAEILIGSLQGPLPMDGIALIKNTTHDLHRWRPKHVILEALYEIGRQWNITTIRAVSKHIRLTGHRLENVRFNYDAFWTDCGGVLDEHGWFRLPTHLFHRVLADVPSQRRSECLKREKLREYLKESIARNLAALCESTRPSGSAQWQT